MMNIQAIPNLINNCGNSTWPINLGSLEIPGDNACQFYTFSYTLFPLISAGSQINAALSGVHTQISASL